MVEVKRKVRKIGNSLGFIIPAEYIKTMGIKEGDDVYISYTGNEVIIRKENSSEGFKEIIKKIVDEQIELHKRSEKC